MGTTIVDLSKHSTYILLGLHVARGTELLTANDRYSAAIEFWYAARNARELEFMPSMIANANNARKLFYEVDEISLQKTNENKFDAERISLSQSKLQARIVESEFKLKPPLPYPRGWNISFGPKLRKNEFYRRK